MIYVAIRPFKAGGKFYPAGCVIDPTGFKLLKVRLGENKLRAVDEHNFEETVRYLKIRYKVEGAEESLREALDKSKTEDSKSSEATATTDPTDNKGTEDEEAEKLAAEEKAKREAYLAKVKEFADKYDVSMDNRPIEDVVAEIKEKTATASKDK